MAKKKRKKKTSQARRRALSSGANPRIEVRVNGRRSHVIGMREFGVVAVGVDWVRRHPKDKPSDYTDEQWEGNEVDLHVGGLDSSRNQHVGWEHGHLKIGDEVTIRILPPGTFDKPYSTMSPPRPGRKKRRASK